MSYAEHRRQRTLRIVCLAAFVLIVGFVCLGPTLQLWVQARSVRPRLDPLPPGYADNAGQLSLTRVAEVVPVAADRAAAEQQLAELLQRAKRDGLKVSIAGARHSMGGHTISPDGIVLDMLPLRHMELNEREGLLRVGAGAVWADVIPFLDERGFSVAVMQSNNDFSIGGSLSVNCHGWTAARPPIASTVESLRILKADGTIVNCSRSIERELFSAILGGYGLFGVILEAELRIVPNERYRVHTEVVAADQFAWTFLAAARDLENRMAFGRFCLVTDGRFLQSGIVSSFRRAPCSPREIPGLTADQSPRITRDIFRAQIGSLHGREVRWSAERQYALNLNGGYFSRNQLLNARSGLFSDGERDRTDVLHEYFVPPDRLKEFLAAMREILPQHEAEVLNITVRHVLPDGDSLLRYADREMLSLVMLFNQSRSDAGEQGMEKLTRELIDAALRCDGRYYLPYRLHATPEQFRLAYPQAEAFFALKRKYDPDELLQNEFYRKYGAK